MANVNSSNQIKPECEESEEKHMNKYGMVHLNSGKVYIFLLFSVPSTAYSDHECQSQGVRSCGECLAAGPHCAWCIEEVSGLRNTLM